MQVKFLTSDGAVETEALLDTGAQINSVGADTEEGAEVMRTSIGQKIQVCSPLNKCTLCTVGVGNVCVQCSNKRVSFKSDFVVLPSSKETPIIGMRSIRENDLVGENPLLVRTAEALARQTPPRAAAGDRVTPRSGYTEDAQGQSTEDRVAAGPHQEWGILAALKSRRVLKVGGRRVDGRSSPPENAKPPGKRSRCVKRKLRELQRWIATLRKDTPGDDGVGGSAPTNSESNTEAKALADGTILRRDGVFTIHEHDTAAAEAEEEWMDKRELLYEEPSPNPLDVIVIEGPPSLQRLVTKLCKELAGMFRAQIRPEAANFRDQFLLRVNDLAWVLSGNAYQRLRSANAEKQEEMRRQTQELLDRDCIEPCQEPIFSQPVLARKPNGKWRFCIDYRALNNCSEPLG